MVVSADRALAKRLAAGVMAAGATAETVATPEELTGRPELVVVSLSLDAIGAIETVPGRIPDGASIIGVIPTSSLEITVELLKTPKVVAVLVADELVPAQLAAVISRLLYGDVFGLEKLVPWGVKVYSLLVGDYQEKSVAIATISEYAGMLGVRRKYREAIEQCLDELLMNALYDAPVDAEGKQMFADVPTKTRISLRMEQKAVVQYACDGSTFAVSVRDSFGTLRRETVLRFLDKCLHADQQMDRKVGGAGLGLYIIANAASTFQMSLYPGVATEVTCTFDLSATKVQLKELGFFPERIDSAGRLVAGVSKLVARPPAPAAASRGVIALLMTAIALMLGMIGVVAWPRLRPHPKTAIAVTTVPPGATVEVDGVARGTTGAAPVVIAELDVGQKYEVRARREGYEPAEELVVPRADTTRVALALKPLPATLVVASAPAGASVTLDGKERGTTPLVMGDLAPGSEHPVKLSKPGYVDAVRKVQAPGPGTRAEVEVGLALDPDTGIVRIRSVPAGADVYQGAEIIGGIKTPGEHLVRAGRTYEFTVRLPGYRPEVRTVVAKRGAALEPIDVKLVAGGRLTVATNVTEARLSLVGVAACQNRPSPLVCDLADGDYKLRIQAVRPFVNETMDITIDGADVARRLDLGWVQVATNELSLVLAGAPPGTKKAGFLEREVKVTVAPVKGAAMVRTLRVQAGKTITVDVK